MSHSEVNATTSEFNLLAELICAPQEDNFKLNLFPEQFGFSSKAASKDSKDDDQNVISIDLGKQAKDTRVKKVIDDLKDSKAMKA